MSNKPAAGRMFQEMEFKVKSAKGKKLEQLIGVESVDQPTGPVMVYIKLEGISWSQYFLDSCFGFWENWGEIETDDPTCNHIDYAGQYGLKDKVIQAVYCKDNAITLEFEGGTKAVLQYKDPEDWDGATEFVIQN